jgi:hypothetical protein
MSLRQRVSTKGRCRTAGSITELAFNKVCIRTASCLLLTAYRLSERGQQMRPSCQGRG